jgi:hypothetical protein
MDSVATLLDPLRAALVQAAVYLPRLGAALLIVLAGWLLAKAARFAVVKGLRAINLHVVTRRSGLDEVIEEGSSGTDTITVLGVLVYGGVLLASLVIAFSTLGLPHVTDLASRAMMFVWRLALGLLIVAFGSYVARFAGQAVASRCAEQGIGDAQAIGQLVRYAILGFVLVIAIDQVDIAGSIVRVTFLILLGGVVLALALAFGLGGRDWAAARLEEWWPSRDLPPNLPTKERGPR